MPGYIKRVTIRKFRSIAEASIELGDMTVLSGGNNSGKSNVLKALNLFFNGESDFGVLSNTRKDFNLSYTGRMGGRRQIEVQLDFDAQPSSGVLQYPFSIKKTYGFDETPVTTYMSDDREVQSQITNGVIARQFTKFLNTFEYFYVPAVRDRIFYDRLRTNLNLLMDSAQTEDFTKTVDGLNDKLGESAKTLADTFERFTELKTRAELESTITSVVSSSVVKIDTGIRTRRGRKVKAPKDYAEWIDILMSGDGILMSYIPHFLNAISSSRPRVKTIWGFEEPENSLEKNRITKLADKFFFEFMSNNQILITTHSPEFIKRAYEDDKGTTLYRVYKTRDEDMRTIIRSVKEMQAKLPGLGASSGEYDTLLNELGIVDEMLKIAELQAEVIAAQKANLVLMESERGMTSPLVFCEDINDCRILEHCYARLGGASHFRGGRIDFALDGSTGGAGVGALQQFLCQRGLASLRRTIIGVFDCDEAGIATFNRLDKQQFIVRREGVKVRDLGNGSEAIAILMPLSSQQKVDYGYADAGSGIAQYDFEVEDYFESESSFAQIFSSQAKASTATAKPKLTKAGKSALKSAVLATTDKKKLTGIEALLKFIIGSMS